MKRVIFLSLLVFLSTKAFVQVNDSTFIRAIYDSALTNNFAFSQMKILCEQFPGRLCGSKAADDAVTYMFQLLKKLPFDSVFLMPVKVPAWERGEKEKAFLSVGKNRKIPLNVCALGFSEPTPVKGLTANVLEVQSIEALKKMPDSLVRGKIVFFNRPADPMNISTFQAYGGAADQRVRGAMAAAEKGAVAVLVRSITLANDDIPHTGIVRYENGKRRIPALAIATQHADLLSKSLKNTPEARLYLQNSCRYLPEKMSANVIAEIRGSKEPETIILVGGHLDCWDNGQGAHDDAAGCLQSIEALRLLKALGYKPIHTLRVVLFMDEEVAQSGGKEYAAVSANNSVKHLAAIESDRGAFTATGFSMDAPDSCWKAITKWKDLFVPYGLYDFRRGGGGVDISYLKAYSTSLLALITDSQRYFDFQHASTDSWDKVHPREMQLGSAALAALIYLIDKYQWR